jgi:hypothetical protein
LYSVVGSDESMVARPGLPLRALILCAALGANVAFDINELKYRLRSVIQDCSATHLEFI